MNKFFQDYETAIKVLEAQNKYLENRIQQLEADRPKWISVEDEPPETGKTVQLLWKRASGKIQSVCGYMLPKNDVAKTFRFHILDYNIYAWGDVTHWMPLPEAPKEGE